MSLDTRDGRWSGRGESALGDAFFPLYRWLFSEDGEFVRSVEKKLSQARMSDNVELFLSRALALATIVGLALWLIGVFAGYAFVQVFVGPDAALIGIPIPSNLQPVVDLIKAPALVLVIGLVFGSIGFGVGFGSLDSIPYFRANSRDRKSVV